MQKILFIPSNLDIENTLEYVDGYIYGIENFSVNFPYNLNVKELKKIIEICSKNKKELFISLNKNFMSSELDNLKKLLLELDNYNLKGILFADTSIIVFKEELNLKTPLVWSNEHLTTNYNTINEWSKYNVDYTYISSDITLREIKEIKENSKVKLIIPFFGHFPIFTSKRHLIKNYINHFNLDDNSKNHFAIKEGKKYPIIDNIEGTIMYTDYILDGTNYYEELKNIDYLTINSIFIEDNIIEILKQIKYKQKVNINNTNTGFLNQETIYKVK